MTPALLLFISMLIFAVFAFLIMRFTAEISKVEKNFDNKIINLRSSVRKLKYFMPLDDDNFKVFDELFAIEPNSLVSTSLLIDLLVNAYKQEEILQESNVRIVNYNTLYGPLIEQHLNFNTKFMADDKVWKIQSIDYGNDNIEVTFVVV